MSGMSAWPPAAIVPPLHLLYSPCAAAVVQARAEGDLSPEIVKQLTADLPKADVASYITLKHRAGAVLLMLSALLGSEPYWFNQSKLAGWCVSS